MLRTWWDDGRLNVELEGVLCNGGARPPHFLPWVRYVSRLVYVSIHFKAVMPIPSSFNIVDQA